MSVKDKFTMIIPTVLQTVQGDGGPVAPLVLAGVATAGKKTNGRAKTAAASPGVKAQPKKVVQATAAAKKAPTSPKPRPPARSKTAEIYRKALPDSAIKGRLTAVSPDFRKTPKRGKKKKAEASLEKAEPEVPTQKPFPRTKEYESELEAADKKALAVEHAREKTPLAPDILDENLCIDVLEANLVAAEQFSFKQVGRRHFAISQ